jgi:hypothetical protein
MKKLLSILLLFVCQLAQSQTVPQGINYQAVALDQRGQPIPGIDIVGRPIDDAEIGVRIAILENTPTGNILYQEEHEVLTDLYGMFNLVIGQGLQVSVNPFSSINWQGDKFLQVELSIENDGEYVLSAVQQLMSVPYAFLAENAMVAQTAVDVNDADADPSNELQSLSVSGDSLTLSNGNTVQLPALDDADADPNNEIQVLSISNDTLSLSNGGFAVLPIDQVNDADSDPSNEIQTLTKSGSTISLTNGGSVTVFDGDYTNLSNTPTIPTKTSDLTNDSGFLTTEVDGSMTNELQVLSISNDTIYLTSGGYVVLPAGFDGDYSSLTNTPTIPTKTSDLTNDSGFLTAEVDGSTSNELQALSISNDTIYLSSGGFVKLPAGFDGAYSSLTGAPSLPTKTSDLTNDSGFITAEVDGSTTNELQLISMSNDTLYLTDGGFVVLPSGFDGDYNSLTNTPTIPSKTSDLTNDSGFITTEQDSSVTNELQTLSISNDTLFISNSNYVVLNSTINSGNTSNSSNGSYMIDSVKFSPGIKQNNFTGNFSPGDTFHYNADILAFDFVYFFGNSNYYSASCTSASTSFTFEIIDDKQNIIASISDDSDKGGINKDCNEQTLNLTGEAYNSSYIYFKLTVTSTTSTNPNMNVLVSHPKSQLFYLSAQNSSQQNSTSATTNNTIDSVQSNNPSFGQWWFDIPNQSLKAYLPTAGSQKTYTLGASPSGAPGDMDGKTAWYRYTAKSRMIINEANNGYNVNCGSSTFIKIYIDTDTNFSNGVGTLVYNENSEGFSFANPILPQDYVYIEQGETFWIEYYGGSSCNYDYSTTFLKPATTDFESLSNRGSAYNPRVNLKYQVISRQWSEVKNFIE